MKTMQLKVFKGERGLEGSQRLLKCWQYSEFVAMHAYGEEAAATDNTKCCAQASGDKGALAGQSEPQRTGRKMNDTCVTSKL